MPATASATGPAGQAHGRGQEQYAPRARPSWATKSRSISIEGQEQIDSLPAKVGADGKAVFENVPTGPDMAAVARRETSEHGLPEPARPLGLCGR